VLEAREVSYAVGGRPLVDGVTLAVQAGEVLAVVGPNGAGKSTLVKLLAGDLEPAAGEVLLEGRPLRAYPVRELARRRAVLPQQTVLQFAFTAEQVVELGTSARRGEREDGDVHEAMSRTDVLHLAPRSFPTLSGGEQARVSLARVLVQRTRVVLLDEPTTSLDVRHQELVMRLARSLAGGDRAVAVVLHDLNVAAAYADRVAVLRDGRLAACGTPWEVLTGPRLSELFECPLVVLPHPCRSCPLVVAAG
jgi:iron complex transport system ATP-binding protein